MAEPELHGVKITLNIFCLRIAYTGLEKTTFPNISEFIYYSRYLSTLNGISTTIYVIICFNKKVINYWTKKKKLLHLKIIISTCYYFSYYC